MGWEAVLGEEEEEEEGEEEVEKKEEEEKEEEEEEAKLRIDGSSDGSEWRPEEE